MDTLHIRDATPADLAFLDELIEGDAVAAARDPASPGNAAEQAEALAAIDASAHHRLLVVECEGESVGSFQISFIPGVSRQGAWRGQIEAVRVAPEWRGRGIGADMMRWAIEQCRQHGCRLIQLTSDSRRRDAHRFYERLGFTASHMGFKMKLGD